MVTATAITTPDTSFLLLPGPTNMFLIVPARMAASRWMTNSNPSALISLTYSEGVFGVASAMALSERERDIDGRKEVSEKVFTYSLRYTQFIDFFVV